MNEEEFEEILEDGRSRFSIEQNTVLREEVEDKIELDISSKEIIRRKVEFESKLELPERYDKARRIREKLKEAKKMLYQNEYDVDIDSELANRLVDNLDEIDEETADLDKLEEFMMLVERFIVEEKDIESPELE